MEDKTFELLTKMYGEFSKRFDGVEKDIKDLKSDVKGIDNRLSRVELVLENEIKKDVAILYDGYQRTYEKLTAVEQKVDKLSEKVERQEVEIKVIKGGRS